MSRAIGQFLLLNVFIMGTLPLTAGEVTIVRDDYGVPHLFGDDEAAVSFGMGYAQAEDRLEELCKQYRRCTGRMAEVFGPSFVFDDYRQRLWRHEDVARENYPKLDPLSRRMIEGFQAGVKQYMSEHPDKVPSWAMPLEPWQCVALGRYIIWGWPEGDAGGDMQRGGIKPMPVEYRGSNEWLIAPNRSADKAAIALIDPHLSWYDQFRFYEARLYGGSLEFSGMGILGLPLPSLGHGRYCSVAMTTGGPDAADCYEVEVEADNPRRYRYDNEYRDMTVRKVVIKVKDGDAIKEKALEIDSTHHGPVVARKGNKAYVLKIPYADEFRLMDQGIRMATAKNLTEMKSALSMLQLMEQNIMIGTVEGDIFYVRNGRVPVRPKGFDTSKPLPGNTSKSEWLGIHPFEDLIQVQNPPQGYMQNCNVSPQFLMKDCPVQPQKYADRPYLFNGYYNISRRFDNPLHQRAAMCLELLAADNQVTVDEAIEIANSPAVYGADVWQQKLKTAWDKAEKKAELAPYVEVILAWNRRCDAAGVGAVAYRYWKDQMPETVKLADRAGFPPPGSVNDGLILKTIEAAAAAMKKDYGRYDVAFGDVYRVGRRGSTNNWPVSGGSVNGIATPRAIGFGDRQPGPDGKPIQIGRGGQTSTQVVLLTKPPQSWTFVPLGQSDDPQSGHFEDQAQKLFGPGKMKPTYFLDRPTLDQRAISRKTLRTPEG